MHITNIISQKFHTFATTQFIKPIQNIINTGYVKILGLDMSEFDTPNNYKTLNALFTRALKNPREFDTTEKTFISPADSFVSSCGDINNNTALQIKGMSYNLEDLLTLYCYDGYKKLLNGKYMNFYLSPKDYHRYHLSYDATITKLIHVPGKLYPVNFTYLNKQKDLFLENERVILECKTANDKYFYMVFVGALNVGKMVFTFEPKVKTNTQKNSISVYKYENLSMKKGDCLGYFEMGSTVLLFWEKDMVELEDIENQKVRFTQIVAKTI